MGHVGDEFSVQFNATLLPDCSFEMSGCHFTKTID